MIPSEKNIPARSARFQPPSNTPLTALPFRFNLAISLTLERRAEIGEIRGEELVAVAAAAVVGGDPRNLFRLFR